MLTPLFIDSEEQLDDLLSEPTPQVVETMSRLDGDIVILGTAGKMGPSLACMARRASDAAGVRRRIFGVARFSAGGREELEAHGITTFPCDLLDETEIARLPDAPNVIFMAGRKFGSSADQAATWAINSYLPGVICRRYAGSKIIAFSTGNVYRLTSVHGEGSQESDLPDPVGEYAMSCLGRERVFEHFCRSFQMPVALIRLNYACDLRYGVLVDLAQKIAAGETIDLSMGYFNTIWQGDANAMTLRAFDHVAVPPFVVNVTGPEVLSVRAVSERLAGLMKKTVRFTGTEPATALLSNARRGLELLGPPRVSADQLIEWVGHWVSRGGRTLGKPTHFEVRDGRF